MIRKYTCVKCHKKTIDTLNVNMICDNCNKTKLICFTQQELNDLISDTTKFAWQQVQFYSNNTNNEKYKKKGK